MKIVRGKKKEKGLGISGWGVGGRGGFVSKEKGSHGKELRQRKKRFAEKTSDNRSGLNSLPPTLEGKKKILGRQWKKKKGIMGGNLG